MQKCGKFYAFCLPQISPAELVGVILWTLVCHQKKRKPWPLTFIIHIREHPLFTPIGPSLMTPLFREIHRIARVLLGEWFVESQRFHHSRPNGSGLGFATRICPNLESLLSRKLGMLWNAVEFCEMLGIQDVDMMLILVWRFCSKNGRKMLESPSHPSLKCKDQVLTPLPMGNRRADCPTPSFSKPWVKRTTIQLAQPEQKREILSLETAKIECLGAWKWPPVLKHLSQIATSNIPIPHCLHLLLAKKALAERTSSLLSTKSVGTRSLACNCCCKIKPRPRFLIENSALCSAPLLLTQEIVTKLWLWCHLV